MSGSRSANRARCRSPQPRTDCEPNTGATRARSRPHPSPSPDRVRARPVLPQGLAAPFWASKTPHLGTQSFSSLLAKPRDCHARLRGACSAIEPKRPSILILTHRRNSWFFSRDLDSRLRSATECLSHSLTTSIAAQPSKYQCNGNDKHDAGGNHQNLERVIARSVMV